MSCFVLGCKDPVVWTSNLIGAPMLFKHPRFGMVQACEDHAKTLEMVVGAYERTVIQTRETGGAHRIGCVCEDCSAARAKEEVRGR